jgi:DNA invertase Pin-like site-specific DNA recombinase
MYLRKSRQDDPLQTVEEVLAKHEQILQEYARKELGGEIPEEHIFREVVSGESIDDREEIQKVLARIEDPQVAGVLVVEPSRLSRGDLADCARVVSAFRFSATLVGTPMMTYDLTKKMERKFFQDELMRGNDYLEYTKEILLRGRIAAVKRGCYIGRLAPYGYEKVMRGDDPTLEPNAAEADVVRLVFDLYTNEGLTPYRIAQRLNEMSVPAPRGEIWKKDTIRHMVRNQHYIGRVFFNKIKNTPVLENGVVVIRRLTQPDEDVIIADGLHDPIIDMETWEKARKLVAKNPRVKHEHALKNPLSGVLVCEKCGRAMHIHPYKKATDRYECRTKPRCYKSVQMPVLLDAVVYALEHSELPDLRMKVKNDDGNARKIQERQLDRLEEEMKGYNTQRERLFDFLETGVYTADMFEERMARLQEKIDTCREAIYKTRATMPKSVDYAERIVTLEQAIAALKDPEMTPEQKNKIVKTIIERIKYKGHASYGTDKKRDIGVNPFSLEITLKL